MNTNPLSILDWNNQAVACLRRGDLDNCTMILRNEFELVRVKANLKLGRTRPQGVNIAMGPEISSAAVVRRELWESEGNHFSFFPRAFVLQEGIRPNYYENQKSVVLLYNYGLAHQIKAAICRMNGDNNYYKILEHARQIYESALKVADSSWNDEDYNRCPSLILALFNNLGYICSHQMDFSGVCQCVKSMCAAIGLNSSPLKLAIHREDLELFCDSVFTYLEGSQLVLAPAA
jgi:hypothetical protein